MSVNDEGYTEIDGHSGSLMTVGEFKEACKEGFFIDYDGVGDLVKNGKIIRTRGTYAEVLPSKCDNIPGDVTHILWYNK